MCEWNQKTDMGGNQVVVDLPEHLHQYRENHTVCIDECIIDQIQALWDAKIETMGCCCGHGKTKPSVIIHESSNQEIVTLAKDILARSDVRIWDVFQWRLALA